MLIYLLTLLEDEGDRQRLRQIFSQYHHRMEQVAFHILNNRKDAEDALQNAFVQVIKHFEKIDQIPCEELPFWLISIVKNESLMILRKRRKIVPLEDWDTFAQGVEEEPAGVSVSELILRLPETYRSALEMQLLMGYSQREIARRLGVSETVVSTRVSRGRQLLRQLLEKEGLYP